MQEYEALDPEFKRVLLSKMASIVPFWNLLGMELLDIKKGWAQVRLPFSEKLTQPDGIAHGGAVFSPADSAVAMALLGMIGRDETMVTIEMKINYLKSFDQGDILAEARIVHKGRQTALGEVEVKNDRGDLIAKCLSTFMIVKRAS